MRIWVCKVCQQFTGYYCGPGLIRAFRQAFCRTCDQVTEQRTEGAK